MMNLYLCFNKSIILLFNLKSEKLNEYIFYKIKKELKLKAHSL